MLLSPTDLRNVHSAFGTAEALVERRRATYSAVVELVARGGTGGPDADVLDSPATRAHLADVIGGGGYRPELMTPLSQLTTGAAEFGGGTSRTWVVADGAARVALAGAVGHLASALGEPLDGPDGVRLLLAGESGFTEASRTIVEGLDLAAALCPELAWDLLPHVVLFAVITGGAGAGQLGSASVREYPGLVVVPRPGSALEVAEALVHEGAHQKFFDLGITRSILAEGFQRAPGYRSSWSRSSAQPWPLEQCAAAFHAYTCLATFHRSVLDSGHASPLHDFSLLPAAEARAAELGEWLSRNIEFLGFDGRLLVQMLAGDERLVERRPTPNVERWRTARSLVIRVCDEWTLLARRGAGIELYWAPSSVLDGLERDVLRAAGSLSS